METFPDFASYLEGVQSMSKSLQVFLSNLANFLDAEIRT